MKANPITCECWNCSFDVVVEERKREREREKCSLQLLLDEDADAVPCAASASPSGGEFEAGVQVCALCDHLMLMWK